MKAFFKEFLFRGLLACGGGPIVLAIVYGILGMTGTVTQLSTGEVAMGIISITLLAFTVAGMTAIYQLEQLPLISAIMLHGAALYAVYIVVYLLNGWLKQQLIPIAVFSGVFVAGYGLIWCIVYLVTKAGTDRLNKKLKNH